MNRAHLYSIVSCGLVLAAAGTASATTINSFLQVGSIYGVTVDNTATNYTITVSPGATFVYGSSSYAITDVIGFYLLAPSYNDATQASLGTYGGFSNDSDHRSAGSIYGWKSNPNNGISESETQSFTFPAAPSPSYSLVGFHVRLSGTFPGTNGNTGNVYGSLVPTPGAAAVAGLGGLAAARRRRR